GLHPTVLDDLGLVPAVARFAREHAQLYGIAVNVDTSHLGTERLPPAVETTLYRILQEAMTNVVKHAAAEMVEIRLRREGSVAEMIVRDDGEGMGLSAEPGEATPGRLGLLGIRERADLLQGTVAIDSLPGRGTAITVRIPLAPEAADDAGRREVGESQPEEQ
ncbi:MAG: ATP-binding protein, partial [Gemmatimonadetes bacterium]|nr:ATP-binding protein [Gemmatimonadota bacterium]